VVVRLETPMVWEGAFRVYSKIVGMGLEVVK
jgi:hypothetical protein